ncbi:uncharacterized protein LODBEIA_P48880 [Lodderomyces beijingensis]|uniref:Actin-binding protein n=1 Tax=Lodderomyces beijingensis TaxID=1775926 RepID=A0ABP0ZR70_9ASCO
MEKIDTSTNSKRIQEPYDKVVRGDPSVSYVVYSVDKNSTLDLAETGDGPLEEFVENFSDGQVQFGLARVTVPGSDILKIILLGWCPDNAPAKARMSFANNLASVSKIFSGYHVQITARDQDDLDVDEFLSRVASAAGARYSGSASGTAAAAAKKPVGSVSRPIVSRPMPTTKKIEFAPKSTGKPLNVVSLANDGWGDAEDVEERDLEKNPLQNTESAYKPTKVNIDELRKQKSDTISSTPKPKTSSPPQNAEKDEPAVSKPLGERIKAYGSHNDGRLTSLPKPKVGNVADKYRANTEQAKTAAFGAKPAFGSNNDAKANRLIGGLSRNFGADNGKTPAQIWAEKRGKYKTVDAGDSNDEPSHAAPSHPSHASELAARFEKNAKIADEEGEQEQEQEHEEEEEEEPRPKPVSLPARNLPPPPAARGGRAPVGFDDEDEEEEEEEEASAPILPSRNGAPVKAKAEDEAPSLPSRHDGPPAPSLPARNLPPTLSNQGFEDDDEEEEEEEEKPAALPARPLPARQAVPVPEPEPEDEPEPVAEPQEETLASSAGRPVTATAEYDYEKDEDNEIGFKEGDLIVEIDFVDEDWWSGKHEKTGAVGLFPANYVVLNQ